MVGEDQPEHGRGQQAGLGGEQIGNDEGQEGHTDTEQRQQMFGNPVTPEGRDRTQGHEPTDGNSRKHELGDLADDFAGRCGNPADEEHLKRHNGDQRPDRVDEDALPLENRTDRAPRPDMGEERPHDRRSRNHENRPQQHGKPGLEVSEGEGGHRSDRPGDEHADGHQQPQHPLLARHLPHAKAEASLEENEADRDRHRRRQQLSHQVIRVDQPKCGADEESRQEERKNHGHADALSEPCDGESENDDATQLHNRIVEHQRSLPWDALWMGILRERALCAPPRAR
ncbi:hypothetical protein BMS3Bbin01_00350 [bacterium BMS3Bbin01]|nr:hypothetical protein BMS3Bbin01_00350 [bacterium BMS3Bbin01]